MADFGWFEAIVQVLNHSDEAMHYADIAEEITSQQMRTNIGATPAATVNSVISTSLNQEGERSPFIRVERGVYWLREKAQQQGRGRSLQGTDIAQSDHSTTTGLINAFGMFWSRNLIFWNTTPKLLGQQQSASQPVDFCKQKGVYLLYDGRAVIYVGRTTDQPLGMRLRQHTTDRLTGRWDRFSWFGVHPVGEGTGVIEENASHQFDMTDLIATMEALLIEGLEPPQNRKRGDDFRAVEFIQVQDPDLKRNEALQLFESLKQKI